MSKLPLLIAAAIIAASPSMVRAQDFLPMAEDSAMLARSYAGSAAVASAMNRYARDRAGRTTPPSRRGDTPRTRQTPPTPSQGQGQLPNTGLNFTRNAAVTRDVNRRLATAMARPGRGIDADALTRALDTGRLQGEFGRLLREFGMSPDNLADVVAGYLIINWEVANETSSRPFSRGYAVVRRDVASALTASAATRQLNDIQKQEYADALIATSMLTVEGRRQLLRSSDTAAQQSLRNAARNSALQLGLDTSAMRLTNAGFVPR